MLLEIDGRTTPDLGRCLAQIGHGDLIVIADAHFPSTSTSATCTGPDLIPMSGYDAAEVADIITSLMPLHPHTDRSGLTLNPADHAVGQSGRLP